MKKLVIALTISAVVLPLTAKPLGPKGGGGKGGKGGKGDRTEELAKRMVLKEEERTHIKGDHTLADINGNPETKDFRSNNIGDYTKHTIHRIVKLNAMGALTAADAVYLKDKHGEILQSAKASAADGDVTEAERNTYRAALDGLNDEINEKFQGAESAEKRTVMANRAQLRFEEKIDAGEASGRLSSGKASSLRRKLDSLERSEERLKTGELSTRDREKLMEEVLEVRQEIMEALLD